jgi:hypothetical protein
MKTAMTALAVLFLAQGAAFSAAAQERDGPDPNVQVDRPQRDWSQRRGDGEAPRAPRVREAPRAQEAPQAPRAQDAPMRPPAREFIAQQFGGRRGGDGQRADGPRPDGPRGNRGGDGGGRRWNGGQGGDRPDTSTTTAPRDERGWRSDGVRGDGGGRRWNGGQGGGDRPDTTTTTTTATPRGDRGGRPDGVRGGGDGRRDWNRNGVRDDRRDGTGDGRRWDGDRDGRRDGDGRRWDSDRDGRRDGDGRRWDGDGDRRWDGDRDRRWGGDRNYRWERGRFPSSYRSAQRYRYRHSWRPPSGFYFNVWSFGDFLPRGWYGPEYLIVDPWLYGLPLPPPGFDWVRVGEDAILVDSFTGRVVQVVRYVYW